MSREAITNQVLLILIPDAPDFDISEIVEEIRRTYGNELTTTDGIPTDEF